MKTYKSIGRHQGEIWENGVKIDAAGGNVSVWDMKRRHGLLRSPQPAWEAKYEESEAQCAMLRTWLQSHPEKE